MNNLEKRKNKSHSFLNGFVVVLFLGSIIGQYSQKFKYIIQFIEKLWTKR